MPVRDILFTQGQSEAIDPKILPDGMLSSAQNVRMKKDGRIGSRFGYDLTTTLVSTPFVAAGNFGAKRSIYIRERTGTGAPPLVVDRRDDGTYYWVGQNALALSPSAPGTHLFNVSTLGTPVRKAVGRNFISTCTASDTAFVSDRIFVAYTDFDYSGTGALGGGRGLFLECYNAYSHSRMYSILIDQGGNNPKLVSGEGLGGNIILCYTDGTLNIKYISINTNTFSTVAAGTVGAVSPGLSYTFDAIPYDSTKFLLSYQSAAGLIEWGYVDRTTFVYTQQATQVVANDCKICLAVGGAFGQIVTAWCEGATWRTGNVHYKVDTTTGVPVTTKTTLSSSANAVGFPVVGTNSVAHDFSIAWNFVTTALDPASPGSLGVFTPAFGIKSTGLTTVVSRPFLRSAVTSTEAGCYIWTANKTTQNSDLAEAATYRLLDIESVGVATSYAQGSLCEAIACKKEAMPGSYITSGLGPGITPARFDIRRSCPAVTTILNVPNAAANAVLLPVSIGSFDTANGISQRFGCDLVRIDSSPFADRLLPANINGQLFFSGPRVWEFDGASFHESGLAQGPEYVVLADNGAGSMGAGTYQYVVVYNWIDFAGRRHQSAPSPVRSITIAANHSVAVSYAILPHSAKFNSGNSVGVTANIYRTQASGSVFFLVNTYNLSNISFLRYDGRITGYTDSATDASIATSEKLYTQGTRGGLSGNLQNDEPPPCKFLWPGNNRLFMGGLELTNVVQWSKLIFPGEPVAFSDNPAFKATVDGDVTGIASLDGIWYVGTQNAIYAFSGEGPDDNLSGGDFGDPRKLPSDIGFYAQRSLVEIQEGLLFQGAADRIYLLPRGGGAPEWIGQPVRDTLAAYPVITDAQLNVTENLVYFSCIDTTASSGVLIIYDTRIKQWYVDTPFTGAAASNTVFRCMDVYNGKLMLDGHYTETSVYADDESGVQNRAIVPQLITGDIRPFGPLGHGRVRKMTLLGEARDVVTVLSPTINISYDSGKTYADPGTWTIANLASAIGDAIEAEHMLLYPKNDAYRVKLSWTTAGPTEGIVWNGLSLENYPEQGVHRQPNARRG